MASKIYTKTGDKGTTSLFGGTKVPKSHLRIEAYGTVDELNSFIGLLGDQLALAFPSDHSRPSALGAGPTSAPTRDALHEVQDRLLTIGSSLATEKEPGYKMPQLSPDDIRQLENAIDTMDSVLPPLKSFVLPGGHVAVSTAHVTRCVCRRAERCCVRMQEEQLTLNPLVIPYLNRLSDYLFTVARFAAHHLQVQEIPWNPRK
jgi:cob(I)alamin adenosyltransferase